MTLVECSHALEAAIEWSKHMFSEEKALKDLELDLEPRWRKPAQLGVAWLPVTEPDSPTGEPDSSGQPRRLA